MMTMPKVIAYSCMASLNEWMNEWVREYSWWTYLALLRLICCCVHSRKIAVIFIDSSQCQHAALCPSGSTMKELNERMNMPRLHSANWKRNLTSTVFSLVSLIAIVFFAQRAMLFRYRRVAGSQNNQRTASVVDGCTFAQNDGESRFHDPPETNCCMYDDEVGLRIIILTFNRHASLLSLLRFFIPFAKVCRFVKMFYRYHCMYRT